MKLINLTPHTIDIYPLESSLRQDKLLSVEPSGNLARCGQIDLEAGSIDTEICRVPLVKSQFGEVTGLPDATGDDSVGYIVSRMVKDAVTNRVDVFSPGPAVRDENGRIIGCRGLSL